MANYTVAWTVPQTGRSVSYGLSTDTRLTTEPAGSVAYETDTDKVFTYDGVNWVQTGTTLAEHVHLATTISGEDQTNDVLKVETQVSYDEAAFAGTPVTTVSGTARLFGFICTVATTGGFTIYDNTAASGQIVYKSAATMAVGTIVTFPGNGILCTTGITTAITTDGTIVVLYA